MTKNDKRIFARLKEYDRLMTIYKAEGLEQDVASKRAFDVVRCKNDKDLGL